MTEQLRQSSSQSPTDGPACLSHEPERLGMETLRAAMQPAVGVGQTSQVTRRTCSVCGSEIPANRYKITCRDECENRLIVSQFYNRASVADKLQAAGLRGVSPRFFRNGNPPSLRDHGLAERLTQRPLPSGGLYIYGPVGSHKTHLAAARVIDASKAGLDSMLLKWTDFALEVRATYSKSGVSEQDVLNKYRDRDHLAIDDFGTESQSEKDAGILLAYNLLDHRYEQNLTTDITTNWPLSEIRRRFGDRIHRRISELTTEYVMLL